jgi:hypothetical protein
MKMVIQMDSGSNLRKMNIGFIGLYYVLCNLYFFITFIALKSLIFTSYATYF